MSDEQNKNLTKESRSKPIEPATTQRTLKTQANDALRESRSVDILFSRNTNKMNNTQEKNIRDVLEKKDKK
jgi:hypothetical protein